nr:uncharacterized mitochondrial protein AtMg00810-like [Tanacetum cinerariifolium]
GNDLLTGSRGTDLYSIKLQDTNSPNLICLMAKATLSQAWLWHRRLSHLNFDTINLLSKNDIVVGLPKLKFVKDDICSSCKFNGKEDEGFMVGYSVSSSGPTWLFDIETLTKSMNYQPVTAGNQYNPSTDSQNTDGDATFKVKEHEFEVKKPESEVHVSPNSSAQTKKHNDKTKREAKGKSLVELSTGYRNLNEDFYDNSINEVNAASTLVPAVGRISTNSTNTFSAAGPSNTAVSLTHRKSSYVDPSQYPDDPNMPDLEGITYSGDDEDVGADADFTNLEIPITVSHIPITRVHKAHHVTQIIGDLSTDTQTRSMTRMVKDQCGLTQINNKDFHTCMFACFLSQKEPKRVHQALKDPRWIEAMQEELLQFKMQKEEGINYEEVFTPVARIEAIRLFLAYALFMGFMVYQMDVKSAFLYETIEEEVYVYQPPGFKDPDYPKKVYKVVKALYELHQASRAWKFGLNDEKSASTPIDTEKPLLKDRDGEDVDVHTDRSMIGSLMYLTSSRPDIMFAVCSCARFQVTPKASHLHAVKRIFRYLKGKPHLGLWYPKDLPFNLVAYSYSDYAGASLDRKSKTWGCQFLRCRLISCQCKKQTVVATSSTEAEYVAAASCCAQACCCMFIEDKVSAVKPKFSVYQVDAKDGIEASAVDLKLLLSGLLLPLKKVIITEDTIREALRLDDAESINCLPIEEIFTELARMGYEKPSTSSHFIRHFSWVGKGFSRVETPLFKGMLVPQQAADAVDDVVADSIPTDDVPAADAEPTLPSPPPTTTPPPQELPSTSQVVPTPPSSPIAQPSSPPQQQQPSQPTTISMDPLNNLLETCTALTRRIKNLEQDKIAQDLKILKLKKRVRKLEKKKKLKASGLQRLKKVGTTQRIESSIDTVMDDQEDASKQGGLFLKLMPEESQAKVYYIDLEHADKVLKVVTAATTTITVVDPITAATITAAPTAATKRKVDDVKEPAELQEVIEVVTTAKLITEVVTAATTIITTAALITVATITAAPTAARKMKGVVIRDPEKTATPSTIVHSEPKSKYKGKGIMVEEPKPLKKQAQI